MAELGLIRYGVSTSAVVPLTAKTRSSATAGALTLSTTMILPRTVSQAAIVAKTVSATEVLAI